MKAQILKAKEISKGLRADDPRFGNCVRLVLDDGCSFFLDPAFVLRDGDWYMIFCEHHDTKVVPEDDVLLIAQYGDRIPIQPAPT